MEEDILNYSPTDMFRGTPCTNTIDKMSSSYFTVSLYLELYITKLNINVLFLEESDHTNLGKICNLFRVLPF